MSEVGLLPQYVVGIHFISTAVNVKVGPLASLLPLILKNSLIPFLFLPKDLHTRLGLTTLNTTFCTCLFDTYIHKNFCISLILRTLLRRLFSLFFGATSKALTSTPPYSPSSALTSRYLNPSLSHTNFYMIKRSLPLHNLLPSPHLAQRWLSLPLLPTSFLM